MKKKMIHKVLSLCCIAGCASTLILASCDSDENTRQAYNPNLPVTVTNFYPDSGGIAEQVILNGSNFGTDLSKIEVYFNKKKAALVGSTGDKLYVITPRKPGDGMPEDGDPDHDQVEITIKVDEQSAKYDKKFNYRIQTIVTTLCGRPGTSDIAVGTLGETTFSEVCFLAVDNEDNLFITTRSPHKLVMVNETENMSSIIIDNAGHSFLNQPCVIDEGRGLVIPNDAHETYWTINSIDFWTPRRRDYMAAPGEDAGKVKTSYKHSFAYCELDGYFYTRTKDANDYFLKINAKTGQAYVINTAPNDLLGTSDAYMTFSKKDPKKLYMCLTNQRCIAVFHDITNPTAPGNMEIIAGQRGQAGHADGRGEDAMFNDPRQIICDEEDNLYVADCPNNCIRKITPEGIVSTVIGIPGKSGYKDGSPEVALFNDPWGLAFNSEGKIYVADKNNHCIRQLTIE